MSLNTQQEEAKNLIKNWFENETDKKQVFVLSGYAGTGKTFLINYLIENELKLSKNKVAFATPTGKAASVLIQRGSDAMTIHRLIYSAIETKFKTKVNGKDVTSTKIEFVKKSEIPNYKLIVLDEISMVEDKIMKDLLSYGIPVLCCGDGAQLPSIFKSNDLLNHPDYTLTEIVRQSADNSIVQLATKVRQGIPFKNGNYGDVIVLNREILSKEQLRKLLLNADQVLCGTNATRIKINDMIREFKGIEPSLNPYPIDGEKLICCVNNWETYLDSDDKVYNLVNGTIGYCSNFKLEDAKINLGKIDFKADFLDKTCEGVLLDAGVFLNKEFTYDMHQRVYITDDGRYFLKKMLGPKEPDEDVEEYKKRMREEILNGRMAIDNFQINQILFGYCISVHKAQGSEWDKVVLFDESRAFGKDAQKWLYTGITRAKKKLVILR